MKEMKKGTGVFFLSASAAGVSQVTLLFTGECWISLSLSLKGAIEQIDSVSNSLLFSQLFSDV